MTQIDEIEREARAGNRTSGHAERTIAGRNVKCQLVSAMTRRAFGFSDDVGRATWYIDGKRVSRAACEALV